MKSFTLPSIWGIGIILVPSVGGIIVIWLIEKFARDERGLSIPEIMYKIRFGDGKIKPSIALAKTLAASISIGSGASIGREGPSLQIGAALSSLLGDIFHLSSEQRKQLIAAGAAAAMALIFNTPLTGIAFVVELLLFPIKPLSVFIVVISVCVSYTIDRLFGGGSPIFVANYIYHFKNYYILVIHFILLILLGGLIGFISIIFIRGIYWFEDFSDGLIKNPYIRHFIGMLCVGVIIFILMHLFGHYYVDGVGFATIQDCLSWLIYNPWLLLILFVCKFTATFLSLGTGASAVFFPHLYFWEQHWGVYMASL